MRSRYAGREGPQRRAGLGAATGSALPAQFDLVVLLTFQDLPFGNLLRRFLGLRVIGLCI